MKKAVVIPGSIRDPGLRVAEPRCARWSAGRGRNDSLARRSLLVGALAMGLGFEAAAVPALSRPALKVARPTQAVLLAVARAGKRLVAVGERGLVIWSEDDGRSWTQAAVPVSSTLTALRFADERTGWAVGNMGVVLQTRDGGGSWTKLLDGAAAAQLALKAARAAPEAPRSAAAATLQPAASPIEDTERLVAEGPDKPFLDVALRGDGSIFIAGAYGLAFASSDGGRSWQPQMQQLPNPESLSYYGLAERRGESLLFGEQGLLLRAGGPGEAFVAQTSPAQGSLFASLALREGPLLLMGLRGRVYRSAARDEAWTSIQTPVEASLLTALQLADGGVLLAGQAGQLLLSRDLGRRFQGLAPPTRFPFAGMAQAADGALLLAGMRGLLRLEPGALAAFSRTEKPKTP